MESAKTYAKQASLLWLAGFGQACCLHRVFLLCKSSRMLSVRTGQCFLLNGFIFLGSMVMLNNVVIPILLWILPNQHEQFGTHIHGTEAAVALYSFLRFILVELFYIFWFYPLYVFSIVLSTIWYNDIAKHAYDTLRRTGLSMSQDSSKNDKPDPQIFTPTGRPSGIDGVIVGIGEQVYSVLLLTFFFIEVSLTGFIPYVGKAINFLLLSWMYAYYCFEYKWNHSELSLDKRLDFFESNWAFFAGFGSPCVLAIFCFSPLVSYGVMAILFPLFVLTAAGTQAEQVIDSVKSKWEGRGPGKLQIFYAANTLSMLALQLLPDAQKEQ
ncbi:protein EI24-like protein isoform X1 [Iris pallida]|uniref:Protein EI24-like protein isoform X1 n=1 Tax=Iris pallida TaxID=29817 RepID=A0AAX6FUI4_IRIPA|nr:protein EI24-like protein isoform X1 [Iris pallida]